MTEHERVLITPTTIACASHGEHLRAQWPKGYLSVGLAMFGAAVESPKFTKAARRLVHRPFGSLPVSVINRVLVKTPMCYYVEREAIKAAFLAADILARQRCDICGLVRFAGPYDVMVPVRGRVTEIVCVECMLDGGEREHAAYPKGPPPRG